MAIFLGANKGEKERRMITFKDPSDEVILVRKLVEKVTDKTIRATFEKKFKKLLSLTTVVFAQVSDCDYLHN